MLSFFNFEKKIIGELTELRQAFVNNRFFGHLAVKHKFHKYLSYESPELFKILNEYVEIHEKCSLDNSYFNSKTVNHFLLIQSINNLK